MHTHRRCALSDDLARGVRWLKRYAIFSSLAVMVVAVAAFRPQGTARFQVLEAERLNVVTTEGKYAVVISNSDRMPGNVIGSKEHAFGGGRGAGIVLYNRDGDESGALITDNQLRDSSLFAFGQLSIDR